jgi:hypothetical protein
MAEAERKPPKRPTTIERQPLLISYKGRMFDVTEFAPKHPGLCGDHKKLKYIICTLYILEIGIITISLTGIFSTSKYFFYYRY